MNGTIDNFSLIIVACQQLNAAANRGHLLLAWSQAMLWLQKVDFIAKISAKAILYNQPVNLPV